MSVAGSTRSYRSNAQFVYNSQVHQKSGSFRKTISRDKAGISLGSTLGESHGHGHASFGSPTRASVSGGALDENVSVNSEASSVRQDLMTLGIDLDEGLINRMKSLGIIHQVAATETPQQNGVVERWHRTMGEGVRTLLLASGLPLNMWGEAIRQVVWVKNRIPHSSLPPSTTPFEIWTGNNPTLSMAKVWGSMGCVWIPEQQ